MTGKRKQGKQKRDYSEVMKARVYTRQIARIVKQRCYRASPSAK